MDTAERLSIPPFFEVLATCDNCIHAQSSRNPYVSVCERYGLDVYMNTKCADHTSDTKDRTMNND